LRTSILKDNTISNPRLVADEMKGLGIRSNF
jgi:hypothetical protein